MVMVVRGLVKQLALVMSGVAIFGSQPVLAEPSEMPDIPEAEKGAIQEINLQSSAIPLSHKNLTERKVGRLTYLGGLQLFSPNSTFGGISGFVISPDGSKILGVSDRGYWFLADVEYDKGYLVGLKNGKMSPLTDETGRQYHGQESDAEAVTLVDGAGLVVSFENDHRMRYYQAAGQLDFDSILQSNAQVISFAPDLSPMLKDLPRNLGVEALTTLKDGRMLAIAESGMESRNDGLARGWIVGRGDAQDLAYELSDMYRPTDMATLPGGDVLVLERHFSLARGMASRLRRISAHDIQEAAVLKGDIVASMEFPYNIDNMEALAVRQNEDGETIVYIMSDNNFNPLQRNLLMMFKLDDPRKPEEKPAIVEQQIAQGMGILTASR